MRAARLFARPSLVIAQPFFLKLICQPDGFIRVNARQDVPQALGLDRGHVGEQLGETSFVDITKLGEQVQPLRSKGRQTPSGDHPDVPVARPNLAAPEYRHKASRCDARHRVSAQAQMAPAHQERRHPTQARNQTHLLSDRDQPGRRSQLDRARRLCEAIA